MDPQRFEELSRRFASATDRRGALAVLASGLAASAMALSSRSAEAGVPIVHCKIPGQKCTKDKNCCSKKCNGGLCTCSKRGRACWQPLEGALCCSGRCRSGKCK